MTRLAGSLRANWGLVLAAALGTVAFGGMVWLDASEGTLRADVTARTIWLYLVAFAGFLLAVWWHERCGIPWRWLWIVPIAFRVLLLFTTPTLSDDVYRYLWDGHLSTEGVSPYGNTIDDPALDPYEIEARALANNRTYATPYLPAAQVVFAATAISLPSEPIAMQLVMVALDLAAALLIVRLLALARLPRGRVMLYLWNPLVIVEVAHGAHLDALMIVLTMAALLATLRPAPPRLAWTAPTTLGLATLTRPLPLLLAPVLWWRWTARQRVVYPLAMLVLTVPFAVGGGWGLFGEPTRTGVFGSIRVFVSEVTFNGGVHHWLQEWLEDRGAGDPAGAARFAVGVVLLAVVVAASVRARRTTRTRELLRLAAWPLMASVVLSSIVHPWYALAVMAMLPFVAPAATERRRRWWYVAPWLYLAAALPLSYLTYRDPLRFGELDWVRRVEWLPFFALLGVAWFVRSAPDTRHRLPAATRTE